MSRHRRDIWNPETGPKACCGEMPRHKAEMQAHLGWCIRADEQVLFYGRCQVVRSLSALTGIRGDLPGVSPGRPSALRIGGPGWVALSGPGRETFLQGPALACLKAADGELHSVAPRRKERAPMSTEDFSRAPKTRCRVREGARAAVSSPVLALIFACAFLIVFAGACMPYPLG